VGSRTDGQTTTQSNPSADEGIPGAMRGNLRRNPENTLPLIGLIARCQASHNGLFTHALEFGSVGLPVVEYNADVIAGRQALEDVPIGLG